MSAVSSSPSSHWASSIPRAHSGTRFPSRADAERANASERARGTVVDAFDAAWLLTVTDSTWRPRAGHQVAVIGPLPITGDVPYSALYMEASMRPGMKSMIHRHSGPEAWYTMQGKTCLETPNGTQVGRPGHAPVIVPGGQPMELTATGTEIRQSLVLILHDASRPPTSMESTWKPRGLCTR
jgi:quercetin dioxygenase-like cupin family protein